MTTVFLILFSFLLSPGINGDPVLRKISKDQLKDPRRAVYVITQITKSRLRDPNRQP